MQITVSNNIKVQNPDKAIIDYIKSELVLPNPDFYKKQQMGKWTGNTPQNIWLYEKYGDEYWLPFGCYMDLWKLHHVKEDWSANFGEISPRKYKSNIKLYDYQNSVVIKALSAKNGVVVMPCGAGKTQCGLEIISRVKGRALWLTHTQDLLTQSMNRAKNVLDIDGTFGTITAGKVNIGTHITFATVQTMAKLDLTKYRDCFDIVIVDECHRCAGSPTKVTQFYKVVSNLNARYKLGLTATPYRADGLEKSMFALLGGIIHEVDKSAVKDITCSIQVRKIQTGYTPDYDCVLMADGTLNYNAIVDDLVNNQNRFDLVLSEILKVTYGLPIMVLANRVEYLQRLCKEYNDKQIGQAVCLSGMGQSKKAKEERKQALTALNNGELDCIFATYQLAKEGLDVPNLRYLFLATPEKDKTTITQSIGRVGRKAENKDYGIVVDFIDDFGMYKGWAKKREGYYKKINCEV